MAKKTNNTRWVPYSKEGNPVDYSNYSQDKLDDPQFRFSLTLDKDWPRFFKPNVEFDATLTFHGFRHGGSKLRAVYKSPKGETLSMFFSTFTGLMSSGRINGLNVTGRWCFAKRGSSFGLVEAPPKP